MEDRAGQIYADLRSIIPASGNVISDEAGRRAYETDALSAYRNMPLAVVLPETVEEVARVLQYCHENALHIVPRGAGTSLSGGALPVRDGIVLAMGKFNKILEIDLDNRCMRVQPGVTNLAISNAVADDGFYYAPDPSSQMACSIGGNIAENSGGVHCLKYGMTTNNILGVQIVTIDGEVIDIGGKWLDQPHYDLLGLMTGSEGLLGVITEVTVRLLRTPQTARAMLLGFPSIADAGRTVADIIAAGIIPAGLEMMDKPAVIAIEGFLHIGYPMDVEALLIAEVDGPIAEVDDLVMRMGEIARSNNAMVEQVSQSEEERLAFWAGRKAAFPACAQLAPDYMVMDGTIPRNKLAHVLDEIVRLSQEADLAVVNVFHAGDGNLHPLIMFDADKPGEMEKAEKLGGDILTLCVAVGGVLTGEHGVGVEKRDLMGTMFTEIDLDTQQRVKCAFDPQGLLNPGKVFPVLHRCAELSKMHIHKGQMPFPDIPRF
ncbi:MAG: FAD-linked oxidase C-terminal domain-containing protein [Pseudomonadota bacterium]